MKKVLASFICTIAFVLLGFSSLEAGCVTTCNYESGGATCTVTLNQGSGGWTLGVTCTDGYYDSDQGDGQYSGTLCGGTMSAQC